jgi:hypothetical protein
MKDLIDFCREQHVGPIGNSPVAFVITCHFCNSIALHCCLSFCDSSIFFDLLSKTFIDLHCLRELLKITDLHCLRELLKMLKLLYKILSVCRAGSLMTYESYSRSYTLHEIMILNLIRAKPVQFLT